MSYSQHQLKELVNNPRELIRFVTSPNADTHLLALGAELLGEVPDENITLPAFRQLLKHSHALVREGCMTALSSCYLGRCPPADILDKLRTMKKTDPSPDLKEYAGSLLKDFEAVK